MARRIGIYVFDQVEVLDFAGPYEVFTTAARMFAREYPGTFDLGARRQCRRGGSFMLHGAGRRPRGSCVNRPAGSGWWECGR